MSDVTSLFNNAELAVASYANLVAGDTLLAANRASLTEANAGAMSSAQVTQFAARYPTVVTQFSDTATSFSATVFRDASGNLTLAIRGTLELTGAPNDLLPTGADIGTAGAGYDQIVAMANWWARASATQGQMVQQFRLASYSLDAVPADAVVLRSDAQSAFVLEAAPMVAATGELVAALAADPDLRVDVAGHSLGGHLAMAFSSLFASRTGQVTVFNAPGFIDSTVNQAFFAKLGGTIPTGASIVNVIADEALVGDSPFNFIAGMHSRPGTPINVAIEKQFNSDEPAPFSALNHSIVALTDSLAVYKLLADLSPALSTANYKVILNQAAMGTAASYERIVDTLETLFTGDRLLLPTGNGNREKLYQAIGGLRSIPAYGSRIGLLQVMPTTDNATALVTQAQNATAQGLAYRYALNALDPFVVLGDETVYTPHNTNGELDLYNAANRTGTLTTQWLEDRAAFLERKLYITGFDRNQFYADPLTSDPNAFPNAPDARGRVYQLEAKDFQDRASGFIASDGSPNRNSQLHYIFGGAEADNIVGAGREDHLYGGAGTDYLAGMAADDYLEGGTGLDIYAYAASSGLFGSSNDGTDTILDADGKGVLRYAFTGSTGGPQSTAIAGISFKLSDTQWQSPDGKFTYTKQGTDLVVIINGDAGGSLMLKDWREGDFGIRLRERIPTPQQVVQGDQDPNAPDDFLSGAADVNTGYYWKGLSGNDVVNPISHGNDLIEGNAGSDILEGSNGSDEVFGGDAVNLATFITESRTAAGTGARGDWASGGLGDDLVVGSHGNDVLMGGGGADLLVGGAGDDILDGDDNFLPSTNSVPINGGEIPERFYTQPKFDWIVDRTDPFSPLFSQINIFSTARDVGAGDVIYAGAGNDFVAGLYGDDVLFGEAGDDVMRGDDGSDILVGGDGNDRLAGESAGRLGGDGLPVQAPGGDYLDGGAGNDELLGEEGDDILIGGPGNDTLRGGPGKDIYVFNKGDGKDTVVDTLFGIDHPEAGVLVLGDGFSRGDIMFRLGSLLVDLGPVDPSDPNSARDQIHFEGFDQFNPLTTPVLGEIRFADGESMTFEEILAQGFDIDGTEDDDDGHDAAHPMLVGTAVSDRINGLGGNDILLGAAGDDVLDGGAGNDHLQGGEGNDLLIGGEGVDVLQGEAGEDTYLADFNDIINDDSGGDLIDLGIATPEELTVARFDFNGLPTLVVSRNADGNPAQGLTIVGDVTEQNLRFAFASGELTSDEFFDIAFKSNLDLAGTDGDDVLRGFGGSDTLSGFAGNDALNGGAGDDFLYAAEGDDTLQGGAGNDVLNGGAGGDTYLFGRGSGLDVINDAGGDGIDRIALSPDVLPGDVTYERNIFGDLTLTLSPDDRLTVPGQFASSANRIEEIQFADGTIVTAAELDALPVAGTIGTDGADTLVGTQFAETIVGLAGDDTLDGRGGDDVLAGGAGLDTYAFNLGMGRDIFIDDGGRIKLQPGLAFNDLHAAGEGNDLELMMRGTAKGALLFNYFVSPQDWTIEDATGALTTPQAVLEATAQREQDWVGTQRDDYRTALKAEIASRYLFPGSFYSLRDDGTYYSPWQARSFLGEVIGSASWNTQTQTVTVSFFSGATSTTTTTTGSTSWHNFGPFLLESTVHLNEETIASDDPQIFASSGRMDTNVAQPVIASVNWSGLQGNFGSVSEFTSSQFILGTERNPNTGQFIAIGIITTTNVFRNFAGLVTGQVSDIQPGVTTQAGIFPQFINGQLTVNTITEHISEVIAGPGDNEIFGGTLIDAGAGNDIVNGGGFVYGGDGDDTISGADVAIGGAGNDRIVQANLLHGGAGDDFLDGAFGASRYLFDAVDQGRDTVTDSRGFSVQEFAGWYYPSIGIPDWVERLFIPERDGSVSVEEGIALGLLPPLPQIAAHDWSALAPLYAAGVIEFDTVEFAQGLSPSDVSLSWGEVSSTSPVSGALEAYTTLDVSWGLGNAAKIVIPHAEDPLGTGVEEFRFDDGSVLSMQELVSAAPPAPSFDPQDQDNVLVGSARGEVILGRAGNDTLAGGPGGDSLEGGVGNDVYVFAQGDGVDYVFDEGGADVVRFAGDIAPEDVLVTSDLGGALILTLATGDSVTLANWFNETNRVESVEFADGTIWDTANLGSRITVAPATEFDDVIAGTPAGDVIDGLGGHDQISGLSGDDVLEGSAGNDLLQGGAGNDVLRGGEGADALADGQGNNFFDGGTGDDSFSVDGVPNFVDGGSNFVVGGPGNDLVFSYAMGNVIAFNSGDGQDTVYAANSLTLSLGGGIDPATLSLSQDGTDLVLAIGAGDSIRLTRQFELDPEAWPQITLQLFGSVHFYDFNAVIADFREAVAANPLLQEFALGGVLQAHQTAVSETQAFGGALAHQYATTGNLNGLSDTAIRQVLGNSAFGAAPQTIAVAGGNQAPTLANAMADQFATEDTAFSFVVPANAFSDVDLGDTLNYVATRADGSALPTWLSFNAVTRTFSGTPTNDEVGTISVRVTATDTGNLSAFDTFDVTVANTNDAPTLANAISDQNATEDAAFSFTVPTSTFADVDAGDTLTYSATLADGSALPAWLAFDATTRTFSGTPLNGDVGTLSVKLTAMDVAGASAFDSFDVVVANTNDAPVVANAIADQTAIEDAAFSFQVPANTFADVDVGDALTYSAILTNGSALPSWLTFDAVSRTFSGTPANADVGSVSVRVTATDGGNASVSDAFDLAVANTNDAPVTVDDIAAVQEDGTLIASGNVLANDSDVDAGTTLVVAAAGAFTGAYGTLSLAANGGYTYTLNNAANAVQSLAAGQSVADVFTYAASDGLVSTSGTLTISVAGTNDVPVVSQALADLTTTERQAFSFVVPANTFTDVDAGNSLAYTAALANGGALPSWLAFNALTRTFSGTPGEYDIGTSPIRVTATDPSGAQAADEFNLSVAVLAGVTLSGTSGPDTLVGGAGADTLSGLAGADKLYGNAGQDVLNGGDGADELRGGSGNDALYGGAGGDTLFGDEGTDTLYGELGADTLWGGTGNDTLHGGDGGDTLRGETGDDLLYGEDGADVVYGGTGNDYLSGGLGGDQLFGEVGTDVLQGGDGADSLFGATENDLLQARLGGDTLDGDTGNDFLAAGGGADTIKPGAGQDVIAFNRNDGSDTVQAAGGPEDTVSVGGGVRYQDLTLSKSNNNLVLDAGSGDRLTFKDWYAATPVRPVLNLQVIAEAMADFNPASTDPLLNRKVQSFDFQGIYGAFEAARAANPALTSWALTNALLDFHLSGSDTEALGGDLAYQYGKNGALTGIALNAAQDIIGSPQFGLQPQALRPLASLQDGLVKLS